MIYVAGISGETQYVKSLRTYYEIRIRPGDFKQERASGRGDVARMLACEDFLAGPWDAICLLDLDMLHPPDILERLRAHDLDMVTGHYYARNSRNVHSIVCGYGDGKWPFPPLVDIPRSGLHRVGTTGMGNVLIKRAVVEAVKKRLPPGDNPFGIGPSREVTGDDRSLGSDFRFFALANLAGYKLWLDADVESRHGVVFWINHELAEGLRGVRDNAKRVEALSEQFFKERGVDAEALKLRIRAMGQKLEDAKAQRENFARSLDLLDRQIIALSAVLNEENFLLEQEIGKHDPDAFPVAPEEERQSILENRTGLKGVSKQEVIAARSKVLQNEAKEFVDDIQALRRPDEIPGTP